MKTLVTILGTMAVLAAACSDSSGPRQFAAFSDSFDDGVIDTTTWRFGGGVVEAGGMLTLNREFTDDYIETRNRFSGNWVIEMDVRLNSIGWNDMFHGISIRDSAGAGVSFGFSQYGMLYLAQHDGSGGTSFSYGPAGSNDAGQWLHWTIENSGGDVSVLVDGQAVSGLPLGMVPNNVRLSLPGYYTDGDGGAHVGVTSSSVDVISIEAR